MGNSEDFRPLAADRFEVIFHVLVALADLTVERIGDVVRFEAQELR